MANVVFLWHMHQPYYVDPLTKIARMPWVRLHGVKGYLDMVALLDDYEGIRANFNLSPVLIHQIEELISEKVSDLWLEWAKKPAADLEEDEKFLLLENYFKVNWDHLVKPFPRYFELLNKRGLTFYHDEVRRGIRYFSTQEYLDLQVWFNLAWCGFTAMRIFPELRELRAKGRNFTEDEKLRVLEIHRELLKIVLLKYREAEMRGQVELTTSPFYHPILPLVYDTDMAARCLPQGQHLPPRFRAPEDAEEQVRMAVDKHERVFGKAPRGFWPSEGAISPEILPILQRHGIEYFCSDEENLFHSLRNDPAHQHQRLDHVELFQGWRVRCEGATLNALFRERPLSDFIGFGASKNDAAKSAGHLLHHMRHIASIVPATTGVIPLLLDGENAWESFADGGEAFLRAVYGGIEADSVKLHSCTIQDYFACHPPRKELTTLNSGSWIGANFDLWIGEDEENRAWELLGETRSFLKKQIEANEVTPAETKAAWQEIYAAEGSDWFWWYGTDFSTENDVLFDNLFRLRLRNVYTICGEPYPLNLDQPITAGHKAAPSFTLPTGLIKPEINGESDSFFEWEGAGRLLMDRISLRRSDRTLRQFWWGFDLENLYFRIECNLRDGLGVELRLRQPKTARIRVEFAHTNKVTTLQVESTELGAEQGIQAAFREALELRIPYSLMGMTQGQPIAFELHMLEDGIERERYPEAGLFRCNLPDESFRLANWLV